MSESSVTVLPGTMDVQQFPGVTLIRLLGEHDLATVDALRAEIARPTEAGEGVVVSLADSQFIDSSVIHTLFKGDTILRTTGRRLVLHVATAAIVERVLQLSHLDTALPTTHSLAEAVELASSRESVR